MHDHIQTTHSISPMHKATSALLILAATAAAQDSFPLPSSTISGSTNSQANVAPFVAPMRFEQTWVTDRNTLNALGLPASFGNWDMIDLDPSGRFIFVPAEVGTGAGVFRYDTVTGSFVTLMLGNGTGVRHADPATHNPYNDDYARFDPCTWTPNNTILLGEETTGGRMFEVLNPLSQAGPYQVRWLDKIPAIAHEGTRFDSQGNLYVVDENNSGSIYKYVPAVPGDLSVGQTFVLCVDAYTNDPNAAPAENWDSAANLAAARLGPATWVQITDAIGAPLTTADPYAYVVTTGGRDAADEIRATPYGRPEDLDLNFLANGNEALYCAITSEAAVLCIELTGATTANVRHLVNRSTIDLATGAAVGTRLASPDNLAVDAFGNIYVIEDQNPGDVFKVIDADRDGVAESMGIMLSLGISGSEPTGMIFDPTDPYRFYIAIQHPSSGNEALWSFRTRPYPGSVGADLELKTGVDAVPSTGTGEFVKSANPGQVVSINVDSPQGSLYGRPFAVLMQAFGTEFGTRAFLPPLWMNPFQTIVPLAGGPAGAFTVILPYGGSSNGIMVPAGLSGLSAIVQAAVVDEQSRLVLTDAHEIVLR
jgi:hypothetical protein